MKLYLKKGFIIMTNHEKELLTDIENIKRKYDLKIELNSVYGLASAFKVKKIIFNNPATIVFWADGTKTVVKCSKYDFYDDEKALAMCFAKKALKNDNSWHKVFKKADLDNPFSNSDEMRIIIFDK